MSHRLHVGILTSVAAIVLLPARTAPAAAVPDPAPAAVPTLDVVATDFAFTAPDTVPAGRTRLRLINRGREVHILEIARLDDGHTADELAAHLAARRPLPAWATFVGGPLAQPTGAPAGGGSSDDLAVTVALVPGRYALLCPVPSPGDHRAHMLKGMARTLVVTAPGRGPEVARDRRPARVVLDDFGFVLEPAWRAGREEVRVENRAVQPHELVVFRLAPGMHAADVVQWARTLAGPPPGALVAGTTALGRGQAVTLALSLARGAYALLCFLPDATDGRSHVQHGMTREITVP